MNRAHGRNLKSTFCANAAGYFREIQPKPHKKSCRSENIFFKKEVIKCSKLAAKYNSHDRSTAPGACHRGSRDLRAALPPGCNEFISREVNPSQSVRDQETGSVLPCREAAQRWQEAVRRRHRAAQSRGDLMVHPTATGAEEGRAAAAAALLPALHV